jgi:hypothetical protein
MANKPKPKIGDRVGVHGHNGAFEVVAITSGPDMAKLRLIGHPNHMIDVPVGELTFLDSGARIVKDGTEQ